MIIKRKYNYIWVLCNTDETFKNMYENSFNPMLSEDTIQRVKKYWRNKRIYEVGMESGILGENYLAMVDYLEEMDKKEPFDNGFGAGTISGSEILYKDDDSVEIALTTCFDGCTHYVCVLDLENDDKSVKVDVL